MIVNTQEETAGRMIDDKDIETLIDQHGLGQVIERSGGPKHLIQIR